ncbi:MAG: VWA domain-containing protein [Chloroflexia bacterium]|nr:VWA domain-containing protein [Chloroflexia bacterium]
MSLLLPFGLLALLAVPLIVVLHMRNTMPRTRTVPTLRFWLAAQPAPVEDVRWRRPPITLLLVLQLLIAAAVALALAQPVTSRALAALGITSRSGPIHLIVLLDGSTSMTATDAATGATRFDTARGIARTRLASLREGDVATLLLMGTHLTTQGATDAASLTLLRQRLDELEPVGGRADLNAALRLSGSLLLPDRDDQIVLLTDGAIGVDASVAAATGAAIELIDVGDLAAAGNLAIVDLAAGSAPANPELFELYARVMNFGPVETTVPVALTGDGLEIDRQMVPIPPNGGAVELIWPLPAGTRQATVALDHADPLAADNEAAVMLRQGAERALALKILLVSDAPDALYRVLTAIPGAQVTTEPGSGLEAALAAAAYDLIVLERVTPATAQLAQSATPLLVVAPPPGELFPAEGTILEPELSHLRAHDPLVSGVDLAGVNFGETTRFAASAGTEIAGTAEGPLISRTTIAGAPAIVLAFDLARSNLPRRVAFPILITNAVNELAPSSLPAAMPLGDPLRYRPRAAATSVRISPPGGEPVELAVAAGGVTGGEVSYVNTGRAGVYTITELDAAGADIGSGRFVVNAGHERESDLRPSPALAETVALARPGEASGGPRASQTNLWPLLIVAALVLLVLEWTANLLPRWRPPIYHSPVSRS